MNARFLKIDKDGKFPIIKEEKVIHSVEIGTGSGREHVILCSEWISSIQGCINKVSIWLRMTMPLYRRSLWVRTFFKDFF